ncbi:hypothetical protein PUN28_017479 [Cardiocondyla obscurior]|uniref:Uncharacterized protein n=1 Tax=Cardiocondyla obscurior TaxID=286306 RepID=A0AAW2ELC3_9HYME
MNLEYILRARCTSIRTVRSSLKPASADGKERGKEREKERSSVPSSMRRREPRGRVGCGPTGLHVESLADQHPVLVSQRQPRYRVRPHFIDPAFHPEKSLDQLAIYTCVRTRDASPRCVRGKKRKKKRKKTL